LARETKDAITAERERKQRIEERRKHQLSSSFNTSATNTMPTDETSTQVDEYFLDVNKETDEKLIQIDEKLVKCLKPHQFEGIQFMWDSCFESVKLLKKGDKGSGCLLAHCMGLGKTLQVIALVHTVMIHKSLTNVNRVLILLPVNVQKNWREEFHKWTSKCSQRIRIYELPEDKNGSSAKERVKKRLNEIKLWFNKGGVFLIGYNIFVRLVQGLNMGKQAKSMVDEFHKCLLNPGPDLIVCDEGHILKNEKTTLSKNINKIATSRRIVLTGTPMQNNLIEYHCMVSFVKPNLLGNIKEFKNRFANPINNGQHRDSTDADVRYMKKRAHILHKELDGCVQRKDYQVLAKFLPTKHEYVIKVRMSDKQIDLYRKYLNEVSGIGKQARVDGNKLQGADLFSDFQSLSRIWTHPWVLKINEVRVQKRELQQLERGFIVDEDDEEDDDKILDKLSEKTESDNEVINLDLYLDDDELLEVPSSKTRSRKSIVSKSVVDITKDTTPPSPPQRWWTDLVPEEMEFQIEMSGKLVVFERILEKCQENGDKLLVFSQSLMSLDLIEKFLEFLHRKKKGSWKCNHDYYRMDGSTDIKMRQSHVAAFNDPENRRARLFIISTKAGGIGINLVGANRCIIFDATWNPSFDTQSIFRIYRFGQMKSVFVYRLLAEGTMEEKIYQRQVHKQSLSQRVIDEHQLDRHFTHSELSDLYKFEPDIYDADKETVFDLPFDDILKELLIECKTWIASYHKHDSLLENKVDEGNY
jgi:transcriptional regulator ATRX